VFVLSFTDLFLCILCVAGTDSHWLATIFETLESFGGFDYYFRSGQVKCLLFRIWYQFEFGEIFIECPFCM